MRKTAMRLRLNVPVFYDRQSRMMTRYVLCEKYKPRYDLVSRVEDSKGRPSSWDCGVESRSTLYGYTRVACDKEAVQSRQDTILLAQKRRKLDEILKGNFRSNLDPRKPIFHPVLWYAFYSRSESMKSVPCRR